MNIDVTEIVKKVAHPFAGSCGEDPQRIQGDTMKHFTISVIHSGLAGYVGTVTDPTGEELHRTSLYLSAHGAFNVAARWVEKQGWFDQ